MIYRLQDYPCRIIARAELPAYRPAFVFIHELD